MNVDPTNPNPLARLVELVGPEGARVLFDALVPQQGLTDDEVKQQIDTALGYSHSEEELKQIAKDIVEGNIFTDRDLRKQDMEGSLVGLVFMPVLLMPNPAAWLADAALLFEYWDKAGPRSINGYPIFFSVRKITKNDIAALEHYVKTYWEMKKEIEKKFAETPIP